MATAVIDHSSNSSDDLPPFTPLNSAFEAYTGLDNLPEFTPCCDTATAEDAIEEVVIDEQSGAMEYIEEVMVASEAPQADIPLASKPEDQSIEVTEIVEDSGMVEMEQQAVEMEVAAQPDEEVTEDGGMQPQAVEVEVAAEPQELGGETMMGSEPVLPQEQLLEGAAEVHKEEELVAEPPKPEAVEVQAPLPAAIEIAEETKEVQKEEPKPAEEEQKQEESQPQVGAEEVVLEAAKLPKRAKSTKTGKKSKAELQKEEEPVPEPPKPEAVEVQAPLPVAIEIAEETKVAPIEESKPAEEEQKQEESQPKAEAEEVILKAAKLPKRAKTGKKLKAGLQKEEEEPVAEPPKPEAVEVQAPLPVAIEIAEETKVVQKEEPKPAEEEQKQEERQPQVGAEEVVLKAAKLPKRAKTGKKSKAELQKEEEPVPEPPKPEAVEVQVPLPAAIEITEETKAVPKEEPKPAEEEQKQAESLPHEKAEESTIVVPKSGKQSMQAKNTKSSWIKIKKQQIEEETASTNPEAGKLSTEPPKATPVVVEEIKSVPNVGPTQPKPAREEPVKPVPVQEVPKPQPVPVLEVPKPQPPVLEAPKAELPKPEPKPQIPMQKGPKAKQPKAKPVKTEPPKPQTQVAEPAKPEPPVQKPSKPAPKPSPKANPSAQETSAPKPAPSQAKPSPPVQEPSRPDSRIVDFERQISTAKDKLRSAKAQIAKSEKSLEESKQKRGKIAKSVEKAHQTIDQLRGDLTKMQETDVDKKDETKLKQIKARLERMTEDQSEKEAEFEKFKAFHENKTKEIAAFKTRISRLESEKSVLSALHSSSISDEHSYHSEIKRLQALIVEANTEIEMHRSTFLSNNLESQLKSLSEKVAQAKTVPEEHHAIFSRVSNMEDELRTLKGDQTTEEKPYEVKLNRHKNPLQAKIADVAGRLQTVSLQTDRIKEGINNQGLGFLIPFLLLVIGVILGTLIHRFEIGQ